MPPGPQRWRELLPATTRLRLLTLAAPVVRRSPGRRVQWGNLRRTTPFSLHYGFDRGLPVDRFYIEGFLAESAADIHGDVLEVRSADYTRRFGAPSTIAHVIDLDPGNAEATIVGDLCRPDTLAPGSFDCAIVTQTLQFLDDPDAALRHLWASLRPGGALLVTVPALARVDHELPDADRWRWTPAGLEALLTRTCPGATVHVRSRGNLLAATSVLLGLAVEDLSVAEIDANDAIFPVIACGSARKPS